MRLLFFLLASLLICGNARSELYVQRNSISPNGAMGFAINYPPTQEHPEGWAQACFLNPRSQERIGDFFFLPDTDADADHPGTYAFDNYHVFDYLWSADSTHVAVTLLRRRWSKIYPFHLRRSAVRPLDMPNLFPRLKPHLKGAVMLSPNTENKAERWTKDHRLIASIAIDVKVTQSGDENKDWKEYSLRAVIAFGQHGTAALEKTTFRIQ